MEEINFIVRFVIANTINMYVLIAKDTYIYSLITVNF